MNAMVNNVSKVQEIMRKENIDVLLVPLGINFRWLYGIKENPSERLLISVIGSEDEPQFLVPAFEVDRIRKLTKATDVIGWEETENPQKSLTEKIIPQSTKRVGIEPKMWYSVFNSIFQHLSHLQYVNAELIFNDVRSVKNNDEINSIQSAYKKTSQGIIKTLYELEVGLTENDVKKILKERLLWGADEEVFFLTQFGSNSALPHYHGGDRQLRKDDVLLIDAGGSINNYWGDITITSVFGTASKEFKSIYDVVNNANIQGKDAAAQNKSPHQIDNIVRNYIIKAGYGEFFTHRTGHGLGLEVHEHPYIVKGNETPLNTGNCFTIEPGIYLPGKFGIRVEDNLIKTDNGIISSEIPRLELIEV
ncbi:MAG: M24 family metallopeptidase [Candidatus Hodarchaeales archaeon]